MVNRLKGGELISHAGHVSIAIHQVQKENKQGGQRENPDHL